MADWKDPPGVTPKSTRFLCPKCGKKVYYQQQNRKRGAERRCGYIFCPWCGERVGGDSK